MSTRSSLPPEMVPPRGRCAVCGEAGWTALWCGHLHLLICPRCAVEVLPRLIADATFRPAMRPVDGAAVLEQVRAEFWRATALALMRAREGGESVP